MYGVLNPGDTREMFDEAEKRALPSVLGNVGAPGLPKLALVVPCS